MRKRFLLPLLVLLLTTLSTHAYDFQSSDLYYNITSDTTVEVTYQEQWSENNYQGLTTATIPATVTNDGTTYSVTSIGEAAFYECSSLTSITIPNSVTSIGLAAFEGCSSLTSITIPNSVTSIGGDAFNGCSSLTSITIPNSVTSIGVQAFYRCSSLTSITIPESVTVIGVNAFRSCSSLISLAIPNSVTSIGYGAFNGCSSLTSITIPNSVTSIGERAFEDCSSLTSIVVESGNTMYDSRDNCNAIIETETNTLIAGCQSTTIPNSVTSIGGHAFCYCSSLTSITIPNSVTSIGSHAFNGCTSLTSITIPNSVTSIGSHAFNGCTSLPVVDNLRYADTYLVEAVDKSLSTYTIKAGTTWIGDEAFYECSSLTSITIPNSVTSIRDYAFRNCSALTTITIPNSVTSIGDWALSGCSSLTSITIPNSVTSIGEAAFYECSSLTSITIPNSVTSIGSIAFGYCSSLTSITIPNSVTSLGWNAFGYCSSLTTVTSMSCTPPDCDSYEFYDTPSEKTLVVPNISLDAYKSSSPWNTFTTFESIEYTTLSVQSSDTQMGQAQIDQDIDCDCVAIIAATANYGYHFTQWSDGDTNNPRTILLTQDTLFTAEFAPNLYALTTSSNYAERGTTQGDTIADYLSDLQVSAIANYGYHFAQWSDGSTDNPRTISLTEDMDIEAQFDKNQYTITTSCNTTQGSVSDSQTAEYLDDVIVSATANYGYHFTRWSDGDTNNPRTFTLTQDTTFTAEFAPNLYALTTSSNYAERGTTQGDTIADYLSNLQVSATANYGYHFAQWSDGSTDNPHTISLTEDMDIEAQFDKNQYTITTSCNAEQGTVSGRQLAEYLDEITLNVLPNVGYRFTQWTDGNTDNPRTVLLTQDTLFTAEFGLAYSGKCGDDLYWAYSNKEVKITGTGAMYNYTDSTMPWTLLRDSIRIVRVANTATSIGEYAFANTPKLAELYIGANVEDIGANAFAGCKRLYDIYCYPIEPPFAENNSFANYNVYVYVPCENQRDYTLDVVWGEFKFIECIGSEDVVVPDNEVTVSPNYEDATFIWPITDGADTYALVITKDDITFCTLVFNAQGQLVSIAFKPRRQNAPAEEGTTPATYAEMTANGFRFKVTGLDEGAAYAYTLTVRNAANSVLETYTGEFTTLSNTPTGISDSPDTTETVSDKGAEKILRDGQVLIIRNGETYDMMGQRL